MPLHIFIEKKESYCLIHVFSRTAADYHEIRYFGGNGVTHQGEGMGAALSHPNSPPQSPAR